MKKFFKSLIALLVVMSLGLFIGCDSLDWLNGNNNDNLNNTDDNQNNDNTEQLPSFEDEESTKEMSFETDDDVISFGILSAASSLGNSGYVQLSANKSYAPSKLSVTEEETVELDMEMINEYYQIFNSIVNSNPITITQAESDREEYENKLVYSITDLAGNTIEYTVYYNMVLVEDEIFGEMDDFDDYEGYEKFDKMHDHLKDHFGHGYPNHGGYPGQHEDEVLPEQETEENTGLESPRRGKGHGGNGHHGFHREDEEEYIIEGVAVIDGVEYEIFGEKELEEDEYELSLMIRLSAGNYVILEQEVENNEQEYKYQLIENWKKKFEFEIEIGEKSLELEMQVVEENEEGKTEKVKYAFRCKTIEDQVYVVIKRTAREGSVEIFVKASVDAETGEIVYEYKVKEKEFHFYKKDK